MRDLSEITAQMRLDAARDGGWARVGQRFIAAANETYVRWQKPGHGEYQAPDPELKGERRLREAHRANDIGVFSGTCPVCDAPLRWIPPDEEFDWGLTTVVPELRVMRVALGDVVAVANVGPRELSGFGIEHNPECPVRPAWLMTIVQATGN